MANRTELYTFVSRLSMPMLVLVSSYMHDFPFVCPTNSINCLLFKWAGTAVCFRMVIAGHIFLWQAHQMDCYFRQSWVDRRLEFSGPSDKLVVAVNILDRLWMPDTHFFNGKKSYLHTVTTPNKLLRIHRDGRILYSMRWTSPDNNNQWPDPTLYPFF